MPYPDEVDPLRPDAPPPPDDSCLTCIHREQGLCESCQAEYDEDPEAFEEFGRHPEGMRRWAELEAEMEASRLAHADREPIAIDPDMPW